MEQKLVGATVTRERIEELRQRVVFRFEQPQGTTTTYCHVFLPSKEGRMFSLVTGSSACVDPANFNKQLGEDYARTKAMQLVGDKLWELEGYRLFMELENGK